MASGSYLTLPSLQRILNLNWIYELQKNQVVQYLNLVFILVHLYSTYKFKRHHEPYNYARHIYGFDTFDGFSEVTNNDANASDGDFKIADDGDI